MTNQLKVPSGTTTYAGYGATLIGAVAVLVAIIFKVDEEQSLLIAGAVLSILSFLATQIGRFWQARELAKGEAAKTAAQAQASALADQAKIMKAPDASAVEPPTPAGWGGIGRSFPQGAAPDPEDMAKVEAELERIQRDQP
jgi:hypothetical protein